MSLSATTNRILLSTEYLQNDGLIFPSKAGNYNLKVSFLSSAAATLCQSSTLYTVTGKPLKTLRVTSANSDIGLDNMFSFDFELPDTDTMVASEVFAGATYSRIFVEFPIVNAQGSTAFAQGLGAASGKVGCSIYQSSSNVVGSSTNPLACRLLPSESTPLPNIV
jgi:hypothetical protein